MKKNIISRFFSAIANFFEMIFLSAAENQILMSHQGKGQKKFSSYTQLKKHQKRVRRFFGSLLFGVILFFVGTVIGPALFPKTAKTEVYIPNGKGDIMIGNVSKNQATVIFKTLDAENGYKPLATKAFVEVCEDRSCGKIIRRTDEDGYAVTHIIPVSSLKEGEEYYFRITAADSSDFANPKIVSSWGDGNDPIKVSTAGGIAPPLVRQNEALSVPVAASGSDADAGNSASPIVYAPAGNFEDASGAINDQHPGLAILNVQNENYLQPKNKIQTIISWKTNIPASALLLYSEGEKGEEQAIIVSDKKVTKHAAVLTTLKPATSYFFKVKTEDENGNVVVSEEYSLRTPKPKETVMQAIADNFEALLYQIKPR